MTTWDVFLWTPAFAREVGRCACGLVDSCTHSRLGACSRGHHCQVIVRGAPTPGDRREGSFLRVYPSIWWPQLFGGRRNDDVAHECVQVRVGRQELPKGDPAGPEVLELGGGHAVDFVGAVEVRDLG